MFLKSVHLVMQGFCSVCVWSEKEREENKIKDQLSKHSQTALNKSHFQDFNLPLSDNVTRSVLWYVSHAGYLLFIIKCTGYRCLYDYSILFLYLIPRQGQKTRQVSMVHLMPAGRCCTTIWTQKTSFSTDSHSKVGVF